MDNPRSNSINPPPARIHILIARAAPYALIIRRGPSKHVCTIGWNLRDDTFQLGQWIKGRIYTYRCDLSPNGRHLIYFAMNGKWESETGGSWTAISRTPYLKALMIWGHGDTWGGGGHFLNDREFQPNFVSGLKTIRPHRSNLKIADEPLSGSEYGFGNMRMYTPRLLRDGWKLTHCDHASIMNASEIVFEKTTQSGWTIRKIVRYGDHPQRSPEGYYETHELHKLDSPIRIVNADWEWAELHGKRILWAAGGKIFAGRLGKKGLFDNQELYDANDMRFQPIAAPY